VDFKTGVYARFGTGGQGLDKQINDDDVQSKGSTTTFGQTMIAGYTPGAFVN